MCGLLVAGRQTLYLRRAISTKCIHDTALSEAFETSLSSPVRLVQCGQRQGRAHHGCGSREAGHTHPQSPQVSELLHTWKNTSTWIRNMLYAVFAQLNVWLEH